jgi:hypothetical protein
MPTSSSWLNLVERWFAELTNRKLRRCAHRSVTELEADISKWITEWNKDPKPFVWTKTTFPFVVLCRPMSLKYSLDAHQPTTPRKARVNLPWTKVLPIGHFS